MKKVFLTFVVAIATIVCANAQFYIGGGFGFEANSDDNPKHSFSISPEFGFYITQKFDVGLDLSLRSSTTQSNTESTSWVFAPYARYSFFQLEKFEIIGKASVRYAGSEGYYGNKVTSTGVHVSPLLAYNVTRKFVLLTQLNFLSLSATLFSPDGGSSYTRMSFGVNTNNFVNTGNMQIGFILKF